MLPTEPNLSKSVGATVEDYGKSDNTDGSSFWSSFNTLKPSTHSTPKGGHNQPSSADSLSFDEDSHWGGYFSPPQTASLPSSSKSTSKRSNSLEKSLSKRDKTSPTLLESSVSTQSLPSPTIKSSKSGPLKLGSSKVKNRPKAKQPDSVKPDNQPDDSTTNVTKELATSSSNSFTTISNVNVNKNIEKHQQRPEDNCTCSPEDDQVLQPVTTSELLLLASSTEDTTEVSSSNGSDSNRLTNNKENQPVTSSIPVQNVVTEDVDSSTVAVAVLPATTGDDQPATNKVSVVGASEEAESDNVKSEDDSGKQNVSSSVSAVPEEVIKIITTPQSDEVSSTAEYVIVSKETLTDEPATEPVSDVDKQSTEASWTTEPLASNNTTAEQQDLPQEEHKFEKKQTEQVSDNHSVEIQKAEDDNKESCLAATDTTPTVSNDNQASGDPEFHNKSYEEEIQQLKSVSFHMRIFIFYVWSLKYVHFMQYCSPRINNTVEILHHSTVHVHTHAHTHTHINTHTCMYVILLRMYFI